jgi:hypothetical protein
VNGHEGGIRRTAAYDSEEMGTSKNLREMRRNGFGFAVLPLPPNE